jgi:hypothetical protein
MRLLDDLGVNLKPAREMGMTTIKVAIARKPSPSSRPQRDWCCADSAGCGAQIIRRCYP